MKKKIAKNKNGKNILKDGNDKIVGEVSVIEHEKYLEVVLKIGNGWRRLFFGYPRR